MTRVHAYTNKLHAKIRIHITLLAYFSQVRSSPTWFQAFEHYLAMRATSRVVVMSILLEQFKMIEDRIRMF